MDDSLAGREYAGHLSDADLALLASVAGPAAGSGLPAATTAPAQASALRADPAALLRLLEHPGLFRAVLGPAQADRGWAVPASPFLVFAVLVQRAAGRAGVDGLRAGAHRAASAGAAVRCARAAGVPRRPGPAAVPGRTAGLIHPGGQRPVPGPGGGRTRTRRFSELDPVRLAGLLEAVPQAERPGVYRRLGDVTLFLTGVFPDYATARALGPVDAARLLRAARCPPPQQDRLAGPPGIELWEYLGARWYRAARDLAPVGTARITVVGDVADRFRQARRVLNHLADRYLLAPGKPWFAQPA